MKQRQYKITTGSTELPQAIQNGSQLEIQAQNFTTRILGNAAFPLDMPIIERQFI